MYCMLFYMYVLKMFNLLAVHKTINKTLYNVCASSERPLKFQTKIYVWGVAFHARPHGPRPKQLNCSSISSCPL